MNDKSCSVSRTSSSSSPPKTPKYFYQFRFIVIGDSMVGKSSIIRQFTEGNFIDIADTTVGVDFHARIVELSGGLYAVLDTTFSATCMYFYSNFNHKKGYKKLQFANSMRRGEEMLS